MKILQVITSLLIGGAEKLVVQITKKLREQGMEVDVCLFYGGKSYFYNELKKTGCSIFTLSNSQQYYDPRYIIKLRKLIKDYDIIHTHNSSPQLFAAIANIGIGKCMITTEHNTENRKRNIGLLRPIEKWMYGCYDKIICISPKTKDVLISYLNKSKNESKFITILNGVDTKIFQEASPIEMQESSSKFIITMIGAFRQQKDQKTLIDAINILQSDEYQLWLVGDGELKIQLENYANKHHANDNILFWGNRNDVSRILKASDVIVMSSHWEGFGLAAVEGMAAGKPVIASDVDGLREVVEGAGLLFQSGNAKQLATLISQLKEDVVLYNKIASQCQNHARFFDINKMIDGYKTIYKKMFR